MKLSSHKRAKHSVTKNVTKNAPKRAQPRVRCGFITRLSLTLAAIIATTVATTACQQASVDQDALNRHLISSNNYLQIGQYTAALKSAKAAILVAPNNSDAELALADVYTTLGRYRLASILLNRNTKQQHSNKLIRLFHALIDAQRFTAATHLLQKNAWLKDHSPHYYWLFQASLLRGAGNTQQALQMLKRVGDSDAMSIDILDERIEIALLSNNIKKAEVMSKKMLNLGATNTRAYTLAARTNAAMGKFTKAQQYMGAAINAIKNTDIRTPEYERTLRITIDILMQGKRESQAELYRQKLFNSNSTAHARNLAAAKALQSLQQGKLKSASKQWKELCSYQSQEPLCQHIYGIFKAMNGDSLEAEPLLQQASSASNSDPRLKHLAALNKLLVNKPSASLVLLPSTEPDNKHKSLQAAHRLIRTLSSIQTGKRPAISLELLSQQLPLLAHYYPLLSRYHEQKRISGATLDAFAQIQQDHPNDILAWHAYLDGLTQARNHNAIKENAMQMAATLNTPAAYLLAGHAVLKNTQPANKLKQKQEQQGINYFIKVLQYDKNNIAALNGLRTAYVLQKKYSAAVKAQKQVIKQRSHSPKAYLQLVELYQLAGHAKKGLTTLQTLATHSQYKQGATLALAELALKKTDPINAQKTFNTLNLSEKELLEMPAALSVQLRIWLQSANETENIKQKIEILSQAQQLSGHSGIALALAENKKRLGLISPPAATVDSFP